MTTPTIARCPRCGIRDVIFTRSDDGTDLVCRSTVCREGDAPLPHDASPSRRGFFGRRR